MKYTDENKENHFKDALSCNYPSRAKVLFSGDLPDLTPCVDAGNLWYEKKKRKNHSDSMIGTLIHLFASKTQGHKCYNRNLMRIIYEDFENYPVLIDLIRLILHVSLLGNYLHAKHRPPFEVRLQIRKEFTERERLNDRKLFLWMMENEQIICFAIKEYYIFLVESQHVLDQQNIGGNWSGLKAAVFRAMDIVRTSLSAIHFHVGGREIFLDIKRDLESIHQKEILPYVCKLRKGSFLEVVMQKMNEYQENTTTGPFSTEIQCSELILGEYYDNENDYIQILIWMKQLIDIRYDKNTRMGSNRLELRWLKCFGISEWGFWLLKKLYFKYEHDSLSERAIGKTLTKLLKLSVKDFHLIRVYLKAIFEIINNETYALSGGYREKQEATLRAKYHVEPWESLPKNASIFHYCSVCKKWANPVIEVYDPPVDPSETSEKKRSKDKAKINGYALGFEKALYDDNIDTLVCGKEKPPITIKKLMKSEIYYQDAIQSKKDAKAIRRHKETGMCCDIPLKHVDMIGKIIKIGGKFWALCEICGTPTPWEGWKMSVRGFTCEKHVKKSLSTNIHFVNAIKSMFVSNPIPDETLISEVFKTVQTVDEEIMICLYCGEKTDETNHRLVNVLRDDKNFRYEALYLCNRHWQKCSTLYNKCRFVKFNAIKERIAYLENLENAQCTRIYKKK